MKRFFNLYQRNMIKCAAQGYFCLEIVRISIRVKVKYLNYYNFTEIQEENASKFLDEI